MAPRRPGRDRYTRKLGEGMWRTRGAPPAPEPDTAPAPTPSPNPITRVHHPVIPVSLPHCLRVMRRWRGPEGVLHTELIGEKLKMSEAILFCLGELGNAVIVDMNGKIIGNNYQSIERRGLDAEHPFQPGKGKYPANLYCAWCGASETDHRR